MKKQAIAVLTALLMALTMIPSAAFADSDTPSEPADSEVTVVNPADAARQAEIYETELGKMQTASQIKDIVTFISDTEKALTAAEDKDKTAWTEAKARLEARLQEIADTYRAKVKALNNKITLDDMMAVQEVSLLSDAAQATGKLLDTEGKPDAGLQELAQSKINELKALIPEETAGNAEKDAFTKKVSEAFAVKGGQEFAFNEAGQTALEQSASVFKSDPPTLAGQSLAGILNTELAEYKNEKSNYDLAETTYRTKETAAKEGAVAFIKEVEVLCAYDINKADYNLKLNKAKAQYDLLDPQYMESGRLYKDRAADPPGAASLSSVRDARERLDSLIKEAFSDNKAILRELVEGVDKLPDAVTLADRDAVYALNKRVGDLTEAGKQTFKETYKPYSDKLEAAVKQMDELVIGDVIKQITELKSLPDNPALKDIQEAKAANAAVRAAYEALTDEQKTLVTNKAALETAETAAFTAEAACAKAEMNTFSTLEPANLTEDQAASILELQELIDGMKTPYKEQVTADAAYKIFEGLVKAADVKLNINTNLTKAVIQAIADEVYTGKAIEPKITVKDTSGAVIDPANYDVTFENNTNAGTAAVKVTAKGDAYTGEQTAAFTIKPAELKNAAITVANKAYTGKALKPAPVVKLNKTNTLPKTDYKVTSYKNNTKLGKATVTIKGTGNCTGTVSKTFFIKPAKGTLTYLRSASKKKLTVTAAEQKGATWYQVWYHTKGELNKTAKSKKRTITIKKMKSGRLYNVRVRVCKTINGKNYWGAYSPVLKAPRIK